MQLNKQEQGLKSFRKGFLGEFRALVYFLVRGYRPLKWRYKTKLGEIDFIFKRCDLLIFLEVKVRPDLQIGYDSVSHHQKKRITSAANLYLAKTTLKNMQVRFDMLIVTPQKIHHLIDCW